jgi:hypothetical protein
MLASQTVARGAMAVALLGDLDEISLQGHAAHDRAVMAFEFRLAGIFLVIVVADDVDDGIRAHVLGLLLQCQHGGQEHPVARLFRALAEAIGLLAGLVGGDLRQYFRRRLVAEIELDVLAQARLRSAPAIGSITVRSAAAAPREADREADARAIINSAFFIFLPLLWLDSFEDQ